MGKRSAGNEGYWNRPDETENTLTKEGWLRTSDIAIMQDDGYRRIVDRKKDTIIVSGFKVYPSELEDILVRQLDIEQCAAIGIPCRETGDIRKHFREYAVGYTVPKVVVFRDSLPLSNVGKVLRRVLRNDELARLAMKSELVGPNNTDDAA
ncbi:acyl-CoA synthetase family protein [Parendozoicomonas callyspongiae]|uniref:hypothetical protein n=1 Tax=Parendozoicomonas callyspongiae TaxID=2942213 RepID=UPI002FCD0317